MIFQGSRYATVPITAESNGSGVHHATVHPSTATPVVPYTTYQVQSGDRLDTLAAHALGDSELWWKIAQINPEIIYPDNLVVGSYLRVPLKGA